jgi:hypothetical protein
MSHKGIEDRIPKPRNNQGHTEPKCTQAQPDISDQAHELPGDIEEGDWNNAAESVGYELRP